MQVKWVHCDRRESGWQQERLRDEMSNGRTGCETGGDAPLQKKK